MPCPRYLRVMLVLGDRDRDLRDWCYRNRRTRTAAIRASLRKFLRERGELPPPVGGGEPPPVAEPAPRPRDVSVRVPAAPAERTATPSAAAAPPQRPPAPPKTPAPHSRPPAGPADGRGNLRTMLGDFS